MKYVRRCVIKEKVIKIARGKKA